MSTQQRFTDKVVIITGSSSGIGRDAAVEFAKEGASVVIHGQNPDKLDETENLILAAGITADNILKVLGSMEKHEVIDRILNETISKFGKLDVLVNNAGAGAKPDIESLGGDTMNLANLDFIYEINFRSVVQLSLAALPHLKKTSGNVLNISSVTSIRTAPPYVYYASMKAALDHWTRGFAQMAAPNVRVNSLNPGPIDTPIFERNRFKEEDVKKLFVDKTLLGRMGKPSEMSSIMKFLCSDEASYVTGASLVADGGMAALGL